MPRPGCQCRRRARRAGWSFGDGACRPEPSDEELTVDYRTYGARVYGRANHEDDFRLAAAPSTPHRGGNILAHS
jgi:hypothetical protein